MVTRLQVHVEAVDGMIRLRIRRDLYLFGDAVAATSIGSHQLNVVNATEVKLFAGFCSIDVPFPNDHL
jgi:hypothetical protein